jgi:hypothetical protein
MASAFQQWQHLKTSCSAAKVALLFLAKVLQGNKYFFQMVA